MPDARWVSNGKPKNVSFLNNVYGPNASPISVEPDTKFVRTEAERTNPEWIVWSGNRNVNNVEIVPPNGWS